MCETDQFMLIKTNSYMNISANSLKRFLEKNEIDNWENFIVTCDYMESKQGNINIKLGGSDRGHNGVKSLEGYLKGKGIMTSGVKKMNIGISRPESRSPDIVADYVLGNFPEDEVEVLNSLVYPLALNKLQIEILGEKVPVMKVPKVKPVRMNKKNFVPKDGELGDVGTFDEKTGDCTEKAGLVVVEAKKEKKIDGLKKAKKGKKVDAVKNDSDDDWEDISSGEASE